MYQSLLKKMSEILRTEVALKLDEDLYSPKNKLFETYQDMVSIGQATLYVKDKTLTELERELVQNLFKVLLQPSNSYNRLIEEKTACREFKGELAFPLKIWRINSYENMESLKEFMESIFPDDISFVKGNDTLILFKSEDSEPDYSLEDICCDIEAQTYHEVSIYVSYQINTIEEIYLGYHALGELIHISKALPNQPKIYEYDKMILPHLFYHLNEKALTSIEQTLKNTKSIEMDQELMNTAIEFLRNNLNVTDTANRLHVHRNTLIYRLGKIKSITGYDIKNFIEATNFYLLYLKKILIK